MKDENSNLKYIKAKNRVEKLKGFYNHVVIYFIVNSIITGFKVSNNLDSWDAFINDLISIDVLSVWTVWGIVLVMHFISLVFGQGWEERKIEELMQKELAKKSKD
ncbi:2TM domain-containing protein [Winogradskyella sp.]|nr:2TM domain-containing protein [Winogradskyella sp.]